MQKNKKIIRFSFILFFQSVIFTTLILWGKESIISGFNWLLKNHPLIYEVHYWVWYFLLSFGFGLFLMLWLALIKNHNEKFSNEIIITAYLVVGVKLITQFLYLIPALYFSDLTSKITNLIIQILPILSEKIVRIFSTISEWAISGTIGNFFYDKWVKPFLNKKDTPSV